MPRLTSKGFVYVSAAESAKPGYLRSKFARIIAAQKALAKAAAEQSERDAAERKAKVQPMKRGAK